MTSLDRDEFTAGYLIEADEHVRSSIANLLAAEAALKSGAPQHRLVRELFRSLHTLKGLSAMVGIDPIVDLAHEMDAVLRDADRTARKLSAEAVELLLKGVRAIEQRLAMFAKRKPITAAPRKLLLAFADLHAVESTDTAAESRTLVLEPELMNKLGPGEREQLMGGLAARRRVLRADFHPSRELSESGISITSVRESLGALADIVKVIPLVVPKSDAAPSGLAFALLLVTDAGDEDLARASSLPPESFRALGLDQPAALTRWMASATTTKSPATARSPRTSSAWKWSGWTTRSRSCRRWS